MRPITNFCLLKTCSDYIIREINQKDPTITRIPDTGRTILVRYHVLSLNQYPKVTKHKIKIKICPISTPILKPNKGTTIPSVDKFKEPKTFANPRPWRIPKPKIKIPL